MTNPVGRWRKSSKSGGADNCVEVAELDDGVGVRDSKDRSGPTLLFDRDQWRGFLGNVKAGRFG
jgi:hypothetical protein